MFWPAKKKKGNGKGARTHHAACALSLASLLEGLTDKIDTVSMVIFLPEHFLVPFFDIKE